MDFDFVSVGVIASILFIYFFDAMIKPEQV
jgi:hypothetical protein